MAHVSIIEIIIKEYQKLNVVSVADMSWMISELKDTLKIVDYFVLHYNTRILKNIFQK